MYQIQICFEIFDRNKLVCVGLQIFMIYLFVKRVFKQEKYSILNLR